MAGWHSNNVECVTKSLLIRGRLPTYKVPIHKLVSLAISFLEDIASSLSNTISATHYSLSLKPTFVFQIGLSCQRRRA
jgi:hypothetical protein